MKNFVKFSTFVAAVLCPQLCLATGSAELYSSQSYGYGRFEARARFAPGDGVVSAFFLWKDGSEKAGTFWNELDFEKVGADCHIQSNAIYGNPSANHTKQQAIQSDLCGAYHTYAYEWTPDAIVWLVDGVEVRRDTGASAQAFADNATAMQFHFNIWPGDASFGGTLNPSTLPVHQYIDWVQYSAYQNGTFTLTFREDFTAGTLPDGWLTGNWASPKNLSTHSPENVNFINGFAVLSLTADNALGPAGAMPGGSGGTSASGGATGSGGAPASGGSNNASGGSNTGSSGANTASGGSNTGSGGASPSGGTNNASGAPAVGGSFSAGATSSGAGAAVAVGGGAQSAAGSSNGSAPTTTTDSGCSFAPSPSGSTFWWALGLPALALLRRQSVRRRRGWQSE